MPVRPPTTPERAPCPTLCLPHTTRSQVMSRELYDWLVRERIADGALISKWRKPGYEILCSLLAIQKGNHNFGTTSHCRVPMKRRAGSDNRISPDVQTGCVCCASGDGRFGGPIWWNTPMDDSEETAEQNRAVWGQGQQEEQEEEPQPNPEQQQQPSGDEEEEEQQQQQEEQQEEDGGAGELPAALHVPRCLTEHLVHALLI